MNEKITIIIPVYNAAQYLRQCLDSVINQTYSNLEIIVVDDKSTDHSEEIIQEYESKDSRILFIKKQVNEGVSFARNAALEHATGDYYVFVDGDDWIELDTCERAMKTAKEYSADIVMWSYVREMESESREKIIFENDIVFEQNAVREKLYRRMIGLYGEELAHPENADALCTVWGKLYRRNTISERNITFYDIREIGTYEDGLFNLEVFSNVEKAVFINRPMYHYRRNINTSLSTAYNPELQNQWNRLFELLQQHMTNHRLDASFQKAWDNRIVLSLIVLGINELERSVSVSKKMKGIKHIVSQKQYCEAIEDFEKQYLPIHWKLFFSFAQKRNAIGVYLLLTVIQRIRGR